MPLKGARSASQRSQFAQLRLSKSSGPSDGPNDKPSDGSSDGPSDGPSDSLCNNPSDEQLITGDSPANLQEKLLAARSCIAELESVLENGKLEMRSLLEDLQEQHSLCAALKNSLASETYRSARLTELLAEEKKRSEEWYKQLRVEQRARQRGQARKDKLEEQIKLLKCSMVESSDYLKTITKNASKVMDSLIHMEKKNASLQSELSQTLQRCKAELSESHGTVQVLMRKLRESRASAQRLQKQQVRAVAVKEKAVRKAREKVLEEKHFHRLLHKGIYTEETRNLIRLLVHVGCSREHVNKIIHAVFKTAGVSVIGDVSRRSVSRFVTEGYYAAQVQLGHEMATADSRSLLDIFQSIMS